MKITTFNRFKKLSGFVLALLSLTVTVGAQAQADNMSRSNSQGTGNYSLFAAGSSYVGLNAGRSNFRLNNGVGGFPSEQRKNAYSLYGGSYFDDHFGVELGYSNFGRINRAGGSTKAEGYNLGLVGKFPVGSSFNLLGRAGTTYGRTDVSAAIASGIATGKQNSFGLSYGVGAEFAFNPSLSAVLQYDEYNLQFVNTGRGKINTTSLGLRYRF